MNRNQRATRKRAVGRPGGKTPSAAVTATILGPATGQGPQVHLSQIPSKWRKHYQRLLTLRTRLESERSGLTQAASQPLEPYSMDMADAATDEFEHNVALCELSAGQDALYEIDEALKRIINGSYGICQLSGKPISVARLKALPWTRFASDAERQLELEGAIPRAHLGELRSVAGSTAANLGEAEPGEEEPPLPPSDEALSRVAPAPASDLAAPGAPRKASKSLARSERHRSRAGKR